MHTKRVAKLIIQAWVAVLFCQLTIVSSNAQVDVATILGTIRDSNGAVLSGVKVTLTNPDTGIAATTQTDDKGDYEFLSVKIGNYKLTAELSGFSSGVVAQVVATVNARQRVDLALTAGKVTEEISVSAAQLLETDSSDRGQIINSTQITGLPLNGRSYANLTLLTPGVKESGFNSIVGSPGREASFNVNGLRSTFNNFIIDGVDNNYFGTSNQGFSNQVVEASPDAVAEFKVQTNSYSAEFGRSGGAVINASFRSGTNQFHGSGWEFMRNTALNAVGFFKPLGGVKPTLIRNQFGGTFSGPIKQDRTFFFVDYEGFRDISKRLQFVTLPTMAQRQGILGREIVNPITGADYKDGNVPTADISAFAQHVLTDLPATNLPGASNNFEALTPTSTFSDKWDAKIDHTFTQRLNGFVRASHRKYNQFVVPPFPGPSGNGDNGNVKVLNQQLAGGVTYTLANNSVLDFRVSGTKGEGGKSPIGLGGASMLSVYGITGLPTDPALTGGLTTQSISGLTDFGRQATNPQFQNPDSFNARVNYSWILGRHSLKTGYENLDTFTTVQDINPLYGHDTYTGQFSRPTGAASNNIYNFADFLFGARSQYELGTFHIAHLRQQLNSGYIQDDFKFNQRLTLNLGVRYEYGTPYYERDNLLSNYDPITNTIIQASGGSIANRALVDPDRKNFAPRVGLALMLDSKTVIRAGYGIGYIHFNRVGSADLLGTNFPEATRTLLQQNTTVTVNNVTTTLPICTGNNFDGCFRPTQAGYPTSLPNTVALYIPRNTRNGYVQNWQFSIQRQISKDTLLDVAYVGNHSVRLTMLGDLNQAAPNQPGQNLLVQARRPIPNFATISEAFDGGFANYNALQVKFEHRATRSLYLLNSFTWSKALDNVAQSLENFNGDNPNPQDIHNLAADRGISSYDQPFNNTTSLVWQLPVGRGRSFGSDLNPTLNTLVGGWNLSAINVMTSGAPINLTYSPNPQLSVTANLPNFIGGNAPRPNLLGDPTLPGDQQTINAYFNTKNVVAPTDPSHPFGNAARNVARANNFYQLDLGLQKEVQLRESLRLEFRSEFFNALNRTNFGAANGNISSAAFGTIRSTFPARQIQFAMKLIF